MVGVSAPAGMPSRHYSALIIGGLWPTSDPQEWAQSASVMQDKGRQLIEMAEQIRSKAHDVPTEGQSGQAIDAFVQKATANARTVTAHADRYFTMAGVSNEVGRLLYGLQEDLDGIDAEANQKIQQITQSGGGLGGAAKAAMLQTVVADARARATEKTTSTATAITALDSKITGGGLGDTFQQGGPPPDTSPRPGDMSSGDLKAIERANLGLLDQMEQEYSQLPSGQVRTDRLADIAGIRQALKTPDSHLIYLAKPDDPSQMIPAATAIGDPFKADHVSVTVPGVSSTTRASLASMTREAYGLREEAVDVGRRVGDHSTVSTIAWMGYQPPLSLTSPEVLTDTLAKANAPKLESFLSNLKSASTNPAHTTALFGHSYGSLLSGIALKDGASANVTNAVMYGSPGFEATSPAQLGLSDNHFFVMSAQNDPIEPIARLAPLHGWGSDPNEIIEGDYSDRYRFTHLDTDAGPVRVGDDVLNKTGASGHSEYGRNPQERMTGYNLAAILLNRPDLAVEKFAP